MRKTIVFEIIFFLMLYLNFSVLNRLQSEEYSRDIFGVNSANIYMTYKQKVLNYLDTASGSGSLRTQFETQEAQTPLSRQVFLISHEKSLFYFLLIRTK